MTLLPLALVASVLLLAYREHVNDKRVQSLLDRIQAPETVIANRTPPELVQPVDMFDDDDHWANQKAAD